MGALIGIIILVLIVAGIVSAIVSAYNKLVMLKCNVDKAFANIDVLLKQRTDEIPNLIKVIIENTKYEGSTLETLTSMRTQYYSSSNPNEKIELSNQMTKELRNVLAVAENYPTLKATDGFLELRKRVSELEDMIADRREFFNESVNLYNIGIHEFPPVILAQLLGYKDKSMLSISEQEKLYNGVQF